MSLKTSGLSTPAVFAGEVRLWSGSVDDIPQGWTLCDGNDPRSGKDAVPDLTDRFIVGAGGTSDPDDTGGEDSVTLSESELPGHDHGDGTLSTDSHSHSDGSLSTDSHDHGSGSLSTDSHDHGSGSLSTGSDGDHSHDYDRAESSSDLGQHADGNDFYITQSTQSTSTDGAHSHSVSGSTGSDSPSVSGSTSSSSAGVSGSTGSTSPGVSGSTGSTGGGSAHENRPSFYALAWIMKL